MANSKPSKRLAFWLLVLTAGAVAISGFFGVGPASGMFANMLGEEQAPVAKGAKVKRGPLVISVTQRGNLSAKDSVQIRNQLEGRTTIITLIPEGTRVTKGDLIAELDVSAMVVRRVQQDINVQNAQASSTKAIQQKEIQISQNGSDVAKAERQLRFAKMDQEKYLKGDYPQALEKADETITQAKERWTQAKDRLSYSKKLHDEGFMTRTEFETDELAALSQEISWNQASRAKKLLVEYDYPKQIELLAADIVEAERELKRVNLQATARLVDFEATVNTSKAKLDLETEELKKINDQIEKGRIFAPEDGLVVYAREKSRWGSGDPISEGVEVRERQEIVTIPREGGMIVEASLHESVIKKIEPGQKCIVKVDALPGFEFQGSVHFVSLLPDSGSFWANPNQRLFKTEISILNPTNEMRPGMSCQVEILVDHIENTLQVPVQAVFRNGGQTLCFVEGRKGPQEVVVKTGQDNDKWVEILSGLQEGDTVHLSAPAGFKLTATTPVNENGPKRPGPPGSRGDDSAKQLPDNSSGRTPGGPKAASADGKAPRKE
jgi:HlyD family secretion protein